MVSARKRCAGSAAADAMEYAMNNCIRAAQQMLNNMRGMIYDLEHAAMRRREEAVARSTEGVLDTMRNDVARLEQAIASGESKEVTRACSGPSYWNKGIGDIGLNDLVVGVEERAFEVTKQAVQVRQTCQAV